MIIYLGSDHAGYELKEAVKSFLKELGYDIDDKGAYWYDGDDDYPDFIQPVAKAVVSNPESYGIIFGGSGQGEAICANRLMGVRAAVYYGGPEDIIKLSRKHNNANILSLGARFISEDEAKEIIKLWLEVPFDGKRHERRINKIDKL
ncbi:MAG: RpiB/LacA/LacB family sugar-phosphate isomerase [Candidatus Marinimicrobia bacterium]|nr:RpiB/LacA/LacB family sugar-phosphate isomerase [Candidatus Neomarinimicrobiota bacterium]